MNITILCVGKIKEKYINDGIAEFKKRMIPFAKINIIELKEFNNEDNIKISIKKESEEILKYVQKTVAYKIALDLKGKIFTSEEMSKNIKNLANSSIHDILFIIGGSNGYSQEIYNNVDLRLCFSSFTFPHQLMRLILIEQIYRWFCINNNIKYHK